MVSNSHNSLHTILPQQRTILSWLASALSAAARFFLFPGVLVVAATVAAAAQAGANEIHMVFVNVSVTTAADRAVTGLKPADFTVLDDGTPQPVSYLSEADEPVCLVVVFDATAGMPARIRARRKALAELIRTSRPQDELGLVVLGDQPRISVPLGGSRNEIEHIAETTPTGGFRALWDGIFLGLNELQHSSCRKKAMVVISDAGDEISRHTPAELRRFLQQTGVDVYGIGAFDRYAPRLMARTKVLQLDEVLTTAGGRGISAYNEGDFVRAADSISQELHNQYVLGYYPGHRNPNGKWRTLEVRPSESVSAEKLRFNSSKGYYAAAD